MAKLYREAEESAVNSIKGEYLDRVRALYGSAIKKQLRAPKGVASGNLRNNTSALFDVNITSGNSYKLSDLSSNSRISVGSLSLISEPTGKMVGAKYGALLLDSGVKFSGRSTGTQSLLVLGISRWIKNKQDNGHWKRRGKSYLDFKPKTARELKAKGKGNKKGDVRSNQTDGHARLRLAFAIARSMINRGKIPAIIPNLLNMKSRSESAVHFRKMMIKVRGQYSNKLKTIISNNLNKKRIQ